MDFKKRWKGKAFPHGMVSPLYQRGPIVLHLVDLRVVTLDGRGDPSPCPLPSPWRKKKHKLALSLFPTLEQRQMLPPGKKPSSGNVTALCPLSPDNRMGGANSAAIFSFLPSIPCSQILLFPPNQKYKGPRYCIFFIQLKLQPNLLHSLSPWSNQKYRWWWWWCTFSFQLKSPAIKFVSFPSTHWLSSKHKQPWFCPLPAMVV